MLTQVTQAPAGHSSTPPRAPSRVGFMRPQLRRQHAFSNLEWAEKTDELDDEKDWEFASMLLMPFEPSASDDSDLSLDDASELELQEPELCKPPLPATSEPVILLDSVENAAYSDSEFGEQQLPSAVPEDIHGHAYISLAVTDHGMSRSALSSLKEFWNSRFGEYARIESQVMQSSVYGGIVEVNRSREALRALLISRLVAPPKQQPPSVEPQQLMPAINLNAPIYPRTGNLTTLRDSRSATLDRAFSNYPLHNIHKTLFLHDMLERATSDACHSRSPSPVDDGTSGEDPQSPTDDTFVDISLSNSTSDTSDNTLVNVSTSLCSSRGCRTRMADDNNQPTVLHTAECTRQWEIDWTERWKVLLNSTKDDSLCFRLDSYSVDEVAFRSAFYPDRPKAKFYFAEEEDEFAGLDDDDDDDYGLVLSQPVYRVTAEILSKEYMRSVERSTSR
ncbi:hypothetical protein BDY19DRAFT_989695 [Irpex rosettiformis]|uniref:Uncharacterized protein n=1 Tax=Irpex rosettiformis TaxID=378272 RepID=A0ACB8UFS0_9APHY|nr:hypothetical protein BDY19DRAFT_989695 [Irpex rosettiformis]